MASTVLQMLKGSAPYAVGEVLELPSGRTSYHLDGPADGPLILTIHGLNASSSQYASFSQVMTEKGYRVLRFDLLGHGMSGELPPSPTRGFADLLIQQILEIMTALNLAELRHDVVGFSLGGYLAVEYVTCRREQVGKLVLISCAGLIPTPPRKLVFVSSKWLKWFSLPLLNSAFRMCCWMVKDEAMQRYYTQRPPLDRPLDRDMKNWRRIASRNMHTALALTASLNLWANDTLFRKLAEGDESLDLMFAWGQKDSITPYEEIEGFLKSLFPQARWCVYPLCQHMLLDEATPAIMLDIYNFLTGKGQTPSPRAVAAGPICRAADVSICMPLASLPELGAPEQPQLEVEKAWLPRRLSSGVRAGYRAGSMERSESERASVVYSMVRSIEEREKRRASLVVTGEVECAGGVAAGVAVAAVG